ncbi:MAG: PEP-CTERM sorting domain-containing protein [Rhodospirillaceae bacterium]|nr:MAG: PEP-CTERM sorting domain-containing protein [Rhodospirillaceae bacterium]
MMLSRVSLAAIAVAALLSGPAFAAPITLQDHVASGLVNTGEGSGTPTLATWYGPHNTTGGGTYAQTITNGPAWAIGQTANFGDIVGDNNFDIKSLTITRTAASISFSEQTAYNNVDGSGAKYADIFIDTTSPTVPNTWNYAIALGSSLTRDGSVPGMIDPHGNGTQAGLYALTGPSNYLTSDQVWANESGYGIGGLIQPCAGTNNTCTGPAAGYNGTAVAPATLLNPYGNETKIGDVNVVISAGLTAGYYTLTATVTNVTNWSIFNNFDVLAASADCANDALWGQVQTVPVPGGLALLGVGLFGLGGLRRKKAAA